MLDSNGPLRKQSRKFKPGNVSSLQLALAALPQRDRAALRDAAPALRDLTSSIDAQAD